MRIQVLAAAHKEGTSKKSGNAYSMDVLQAVFWPTDGEPVVGEVTLPKDHDKVGPGMYTPAFSVKRTPDGKLIASISKLIAIPAGHAQAKP